jgi:ABC-type transport system substrate-binding protein
MFHSLVSLDEREQDWVGVLAKSWKASVDRLSYNFVLCNDLRWPNDRPVTAEDVAFTIRVIKNPDTENFDPFLASFFERTTVHDPFNITIHLTRQFFEPLSLLSFKILPAYAFSLPLQLRDVTSECRELQRGTSYRVVLRDDIRWPNGGTIEVEDILHSAERWKMRAARGEKLPEGTAFAEVTPDGKRAAKFGLKQPLRSAEPLLGLPVVPRYALDAPLKLRDVVVRSEPTDGKATAFHLRDDVSWPVGAKVTADGVARYLQLVRLGRVTTSLPTGYVKACDVKDERTLVVSVDDQSKGLEPLLDLTLAPPAHEAEASLVRGHWFQRTPLGSGPFLRDPSGDRGESERYFRRNMAYYLATRPPESAFLNHRPFLAGIALKIYHDRAAARQALEVERSKETSIDVSVELRPLDIEFFSNLPENYYLRRFRQWQIHFLAFNFRRPLFQNRDVRLAVWKGIDRAAVLEKIFRGGRGGQPHVLLTGPYPKGSWAYNMGIADYLHSVAQAREHLAKAHAAKPTFSLKFPSYDRNIERACSNFQETLEQAGIDVRLERKLERDLYDEVVNQHDFDVVYWTHTFDETLDLAPLLDSSRAGMGGTNFSGYQSDLLMERFRELNARPNADRIQAIAHDVHRLCHDEAVFATLWQLDIWSAFRKEVKEEQVSIHPFLFFNNVQEWTIR